MDHSTKTSERITAILSTVVAVAILAAGVTAQQSRSARTDELVHLDSDLRFQLESTFRLNPKLGVERVKQLETVLASWRQAPQTEVDRRLLADWLLEATIRSMPGSIEPLPPAPQFGQSESPQSSAKISLVVNADDLDQPSYLTPIAATENLSQNGLRRGTGTFLLRRLRKNEPVPDRSGIGSEAVSSVSSDALTEQLLVDPTPTPGEHPLKEVSTKVARPETLPVTPQVVEPVKINLTELTARIAGYHRGLDEVEAGLLAHERPQFDRLLRQIHLLDGLTEDYQFVRLYYESLTPAERRTVEPPRSMEATLAELLRHLDRFEREVQADFLGEFDTAMAERLAHLRSQLDVIASRVDW